MKLVISLLFLSLLSAPTLAKEYIYQGKVQGMVCAFCVYSVSKKIAQLPQVDAQSINVDLKSGTISFRSKAKMGFKKVSRLFAETGFKLTVFNEVKQAALKTVAYQAKPIMSFKLENLDVEKYEAILSSIGDIAASSLGKLVIIAPSSVEIAILKPMIMGKQKIARVQYQTEKQLNSIEIKLFLRAN
ncbi:hypothetical protein MNBD_GAMMA21-1808 [hydrothermal vent metagenome]|uniref:HMA domain-containing protein n=1 Tax=hydrothermal vent metagenome TaxID=652676 RepID=A0A3B0ZNJ4_9ZZZZ